MSRLNPGTIFAGLLAILVAMAGAYTVKKLLERPDEIVEAPAVERVTVPVAAYELAAGKTIGVGDINILSLTREQIANYKPELPAFWMTNSSQIIGRILRQDIGANEGFAADYFYPVGTGPTVADKLKPGFRAVTIVVDAAGFVDGQASPGTHVDVLFRLELDGTGRTRPATTYTILEGVEVLAVDRATFPKSQSNPRGGEGIRVTLAVTPEQGGQLKVLEGRGELSLALRSPGEMPRGMVQSDLDKAKVELNLLTQEASALKEIIQAAVDIGTDFDDQGRLKKLQEEISQREQDVRKLESELTTLVSAPATQTFEEVLQLKETRPSIVEKLGPGMRAVTVAVRGSGYVDGFAMPGTFVDVLFRLTDLAGRQDYNETTFTVLEGVEILAVNRSTDPVTMVANATGNTQVGLPVTLAVTPEQASKLKVIEGRGEISLVLRSPNETERQTFEAKMEDVSLQLEELKIEEDALQQIEEIAKRRGVPFRDKERLQEVALLIRVREKELQNLEEKAASVKEPPKQSTLAGVLGIPEPEQPPPPPTPPTPRKLEIYMGGDRRDVLFGT